VERLPLGSKEYLVVDVTERLNNLTTLDDIILTFDVTDNEGTDKINDEPATNQDMKAYCLIDTTGWRPDEYELSLKMIVGVEAPILGPFPFKVG
jgi:hypothetical protein